MLAQVLQSIPQGKNSSPGATYSRLQEVGTVPGKLGQLCKPIDSQVRLIDSDGASFLLNKHRIAAAFVCKKAGYCVWLLYLRGRRKVTQVFALPSPLVLFFLLSYINASFSVSGQAGNNKLSCQCFSAEPRDLWSMIHFITPSSAGSETSPPRPTCAVCLEDTVTQKCCKTNRPKNEMHLLNFHCHFSLLSSGSF